jgi:transcriptional regulator with XRE-family HTH domain
MQRKRNFAALLRWWRAQRGLSQLALAHRASISHELGRAQPSRDMVKQIAEALDVPLRHQCGESFGRGLSEPRKRSGR